MHILGTVASSYYIPTGSFESIATTTVGAGGATTITFSNIPQTYKHLQIRGISTCTRTDGDDNYIMNFNGETPYTNSNYATHVAYGTGSTVSSWSNTGSYIWLFYISSTSFVGSNNYAPVVCDILDYTNTNKAKTVRFMTGFDSNGGNRNRVALGSGMWTGTSAITSITLIADASQTLSQNTTLALYGIKG